MEREILTEEKVKELIDEIQITRDVDDPRFIKGVLYIKDFYISDAVYNTISLCIFELPSSFILESYYDRCIKEQNYKKFFIVFMNCEFDNTMIDTIFVSNALTNFGPCRLEYQYDKHCIFDSFPLVCPSEGEFIGWKALLLQESNEENKESHVVAGVIGKLLIPADAKRSSAFRRKCRCSKAKLLEVYALDNLSGPLCVEENEILTSYMNYEFEYKIGEMAYSDDFDENRWNECSNGILFFMTREEAVEYAKA